MPFSTNLTSWLLSNGSFVNDSFEEDLQGGRALGPASGALWDAYPFLRGCQYSGLFAGLSLSGVGGECTDVRILEYSASFGFVPAVDGPFAGDKWQEISGDQWQQITPHLYTPCNYDPPAHPADLRLSIGGKVVDTMAWQYSSYLLSSKYRQHSWVGGGYCLIAVTFVDRPEHAAPFLRPCFVSGASARIDPQCLYTVTPASRLFSGRTALVPGERVSLSVRDSTITILKEASEDDWRVVQKISKVSPDTEGRLSFVSSGCHKFARPIEEQETVDSPVELMEGVLEIQNACRPCCDCQDYIKRYEELGELDAKYRDLILQFNDLYAESMLLREQLIAMLREKVSLVQARLGEWGENLSGFHCTLWVTVTATTKIKPPESVKIRLTKDGIPLHFHRASIIDQSDALIVQAGVCVGGDEIELSDISANYVGAKTVRLRLRFQEHFDVATFDPSKIEITVDGEV